MNPSAKIFNHYLSYFVLALFCFGIAYQNMPHVDAPEKIVTSIEKTLHQKETVLEEEMQTLSEAVQEHSYEELFVQKLPHYQSLVEHGIILLIYENDTLRFWTDNAIAVENQLNTVCLDNQMAQLKNGWFAVKNLTVDLDIQQRIVGLITIKNEYPYQNQYLQNSFHPDFHLHDNASITVLGNVDEPAAVKDKAGAYLFSIEHIESISNEESFNASFFCLLSFIFFLLFLHALILKYVPESRKNGALFLLLMLATLFRAWSIYAKFPESIYQLNIFNPQHYGDSGSFWLPSLGDLLLNVLLLFYATYLFKNYWSSLLRKFRNKIVFAVCCLLPFLFSLLVNSLFTGLVHHSSISFDVNNLFQLNVYSYYGLSALVILFLSFILLADPFIRIAVEHFNSTKRKLLLTGGLLLAHMLIAHLLGEVNFFMVIWPLVMILIIYQAILKDQHTYPFSSSVSLIFAFALFAVYVFLKESQHKERSHRKVFAEKLAAENDPIAEHLFSSLKKRIDLDTSITYSVLQGEEGVQAIDKKLRQEYFSGFWEKFNMDISLFDQECLPLLNPENVNKSNLGYFDELIENKGVATFCEDLFFIDNHSGKINYVGRIPLTHKDDEQSCATLFIELESKFVSEEIGFPELLLDQKVSGKQDLANYSYAKYYNGKLINQYGAYPYPLSTQPFEEVEHLSFYASEDFEHLIYQANENTLVLLSQPLQSFTEKVTSFSFLFAFFGAFIFIALLVRQFFSGIPVFQFQFNTRIQLLLVAIMLLSLLLFGGGTIYYIQQQYDAKNQEIISEKIHSVLIEVEHKLEKEKRLNNALEDYASYILKKFSNVFFTDINLYDLQGNLYASSRPKVFQEGLLSEKIHPEAFLNVAVQQKTEYIHHERIGNLNYLSAYVPFHNKDGQLMAYLSLPYFAKQDELEKEISGFLVALINIYVLLFALSILVALFITRYVTKPLRLIQEKMSGISLGKSNELIDWKDKDEIGSLVNEYNRMVVALAESAERLAHSERESAWREMAQQVAHEIKNPLTPMKLSVQHLQRTWKDNPEDMDERITKLSQTLIEQIETLSTIAGEFSNFAQMPEPAFENIDIVPVLKNAISLYEDNPNLKLNQDLQVESALISGDKDQLLRVFNNLLKNATQAIPEDREGKIDVSLKTEGEQFIIEVKDNGVGIPQDELERVFVPKFTTKSGGTGLGLAMSKSIVESFGGKIALSSQIHQETSFIIRLPKR